MNEEFQTAISDEEWAAARTAHQHHLDLVRQNPEAQAAFDETTAVIERHQAGT